jgi:TRAP-type C4-dicarboxylate transport system substrate-binding protein
MIALVAAAAIPLAAAPPPPQVPQNIRLATLVPDTSPWTRALRSMGAAWQKATTNRVKLTVYPGGFPSESSIIARMGVGGMEAATMMVAGLGELDPAFNVFGIPFFYESDAELEYVQQKLTPMLSQRLEAKKYHLINWGNGGWVRLFSKMPIRSIAELKAAKLYTTDGDPKTVKWYADNGFNAQPLDTGEIPKQLKNPLGIINATPSPPAYAVLFYRDAPYMLDLRLGPLVAATVMTDKAWAKISPEDRASLLAAAADTEKQVNAAAPALDQKSIDEMKKGTPPLNVVTLDARQLAEFKAAADKATITQRGFIVPADVFDAAIRERDAYRKTKK